MTNEDEKYFNAMLIKDNAMPKIEIITDEASIKKYGGTRMFFVPPKQYGTIMKSIPIGKVITVGEIHNYLEKNNHADFTDPITAGIFVSIVTWASHQRSDKKTSYWRTLKANGQLNEKYPGGVEAQKEKSELEGHVIIQRGRTNIRYYVKGYQTVLF